MKVIDDNGIWWYYQPNGPRRRLHYRVCFICGGEDFVLKGNLNKICNKCKYDDEERNRKISIATRGENNPLWKGDAVARTALHNYIRRRKPKPEFCESCGEEKPRDLANISNEYKRDVNDFRWICRRCHMKSDGRLAKLGEWQFKKKKA